LLPHVWWKASSGWRWRITTEVYLAALRAAAQSKGAPLDDWEKAQVFKAAQREALRQRFLNVIRLAGYKGNAPEEICAEYLDNYMQNVPEFEAMLKEYEDHNEYDGRFHQ
jgi:hypothetical protein